MQQVWRFWERVLAEVASTALVSLPGGLRGLATTDVWVYKQLLLFGGNPPNGSKYLITKDLGPEDHIHYGFWDLILHGEVSGTSGLYGASCGDYPLAYEPSCKRLLNPIARAVAEPKAVISY